MCHAVSGSANIWLPCDRTGKKSEIKTTSQIEGNSHRNRTEAVRFAPVAWISTLDPFGAIDIGIACRELSSIGG